MNLSAAVVAILFHTLLWIQPLQVLAGCLPISSSQSCPFWSGGFSIDTQLFPQITSSASFDALIVAQSATEGSSLFYGTSGWASQAIISMSQRPEVQTCAYHASGSPYTPQPDLLYTQPIACAYYILASQKNCPAPTPPKALCPSVCQTSASSMLSVLRQQCVLSLSPLVPIVNDPSFVAPYLSSCQALQSSSSSNCISETDIDNTPGAYCGYALGGAPGSPQGWNSQTQTGLPRCDALPYSQQPCCTGNYPTPQPPAPASSTTTSASASVASLSASASSTTGPPAPLTTLTSSSAGPTPTPSALPQNNASIPPDSRSVTLWTGLGLGAFLLLLTSIVAALLYRQYRFHRNHDASDVVKLNDLGPTKASMRRRQVSPPLIKNYKQTTPFRRSPTQIKEQAAQRASGEAQALTAQQTSPDPSPVSLAPKSQHGPLHIPFYATMTGQLWMSVKQFDARYSDEVSASRGDLIRVLSVFDDGWAKVCIIDSIQVPGTAGCALLLHPQPRNLCRAHKVDSCDIISLAHDFTSRPSTSLRPVQEYCL
ncbi:uncharacterized protein BJ171DRAFT_282346 [Polychytrium aggregatum]|uniref:uncharacterized protein n=1 Tax=Polychytrium aggregatum TaxID=110093 RepID=UPI0022FF09D2|nr:uncharacterized protein BJ171DRAFT_282346 [Polychytrium aggregatum]KAI9193261.1 hypothetical protein BJ171DRAFT_282346 [Polychytrium aggregatum]